MLAYRFSLCFLFPFFCFAQGPVTIGSGKVRLTLAYDGGARVTGLSVNGQPVLNATGGAYTSITVGPTTWSSLHLLSAPVLTRAGDSVVLDKIAYGDAQAPVRERWVFRPSASAVQWAIRRSMAPGTLEESATPIFHFSDMKVWDGAYQGYGGLAWFYLFNERLCTYGVHTSISSFWNSHTGNGLDVRVGAPGKPVAMRYTRTNDDQLAFAITVADKEMLPRYDSGTNRRRFLRGKTDVWGPYEQGGGVREEMVDLRYFDVNQRYGRGKLVGIDGSKVAAVLNTIARIGVIDSLHFGANSWHTPYGPICLHEQYIAQMGLGIDDPSYLRGYQSCLEFYRDHAIRPDGRVIARWAYTNEDMMPGEVTPEGFYEAQWGYLLDSNPDFVTDVSELFDLTGDTAWVRRQQTACEKALDWILRRDSDGDGLVEMMTDNEHQKRGSDWIDIIWASYENAFVNAKLYYAMTKWAHIEWLLDNREQALRYADLARKLKEHFNKPTSAGGFWDEEKQCYVHWLDKDGSVHGRNMVTPVNFMAIAYGICDDTVRSHHILDAIETRMQQENLFFWPLCMTSYAPGEGNDWQWPFPNYENGDLFLSWGSVAVKAYASYKPAIAMKYIRKVLDRYSQDGLAFQRYGRKKQDGLGDDILAGNALSIVGLYQSIYGVNPLENRLYLAPHLTPELGGTELTYTFHGGKLHIRLQPDKYSIGNGRYWIEAENDFGYNATADNLEFFAGGNGSVALRAHSAKTLMLSISSWGPEEKHWKQTAAGSVEYALGGLVPGKAYTFFADGKLKSRIKADGSGVLRFHSDGGAAEFQFK